MQRLTAGGLLTAVAICLATSGPAEARPQYQEAFGREYPSLKAELARVRCETCHCGKTKKLRNDYGEALEKALKIKNVKRLDIVRQMMRSIEDEPSAEEGKTFGDLIGEGRLPGTCPQPEPEPEAL